VRLVTATLVGEGERQSMRYKEARIVHNKQQAHNVLSERQGPALGANAGYEFNKRMSRANVESSGVEFRRAYLESLRRRFNPGLEHQHNP